MAVPTSGVGGVSVKFNPSLHPRAPKGTAAGGQFAAGGSASSSSSKTAQSKSGKKTVPPNGLGYSSAQWAQLQKLEAMAKAGKKLDAHQQHLLHVAHEKRLAAIGKAKPAAKPKAAKKTTKKTTAKAKPKTTAKKSTSKPTTAAQKKANAAKYHL